LPPKRGHGRNKAYCSDIRTTQANPHGERDRKSTPRQTIPKDGRLPFKNAIAEMIERKEREFADYLRPILDFELVDKGNQRYDLTVLSETTTEEQRLYMPPEK